MSVFFRRSCGAALAYAVATQGAFADLSANDVWSDWQAYMGSMGYTITGEQNTSGDVTTITNMTMKMDLPEGEGSFDMVVPEMTLTENGDGTVSIEFPESFPMTVSGQAEEEEFSVDILYSQTGLKMLVSGSPDDMTYDYSASKLALALDNIMVDGEAMPDDALDLGFEMINLAGASRMQIGEGRKVDQNFTAANLTYDLNFQDPETGEDARINGKLDQLEFEGKNVIPEGFSLADVEGAYEAGFAFDGIFTYGAGQTSIAGTSEGEAFSMASSSDGGRFGASIDAERLAYDVEQNNAKLEVTTADLPFPIEIAMAKAGLKLEAPIQASEEVKPFGFAMNLTDFTMSDILWSMFDPAGALPRDPATIALDATGTAKVLLNFLDPEVAEALESSDEVPAELHSLKVNELLVSMVGAKLTGTGDFTFDNSNTEEFGGVPAPAGEANLQLVGANALIDKLIGMGFMSENDAMGARMMMGMMAVPGDQPDTLNSKIEFTKDGQILANGQRIK
ncbi:DUF2125 domain-containing protein [Ruegeria arenilitoris]|uniref:DUF2125 domain-containing protein n=1 Tax=Ruegeria arenilitoris TaxID=1173585 RepID=UPI00147EA35D|nr:DUF2125 domain-containing protein [Ruegeria arenilitoris]